jgi:hypothetical protein
MIPVNKWPVHHRGHDVDCNTTLETNIHLLSGILTHDTSNRATADLCLRPRGHWDWHMDLVSYLPTYLPIYLLTYLPTYLPSYLLTYILIHLPTHLLTHFMEQSPWEANRFSASQISRVLWNPKVHYHIHECLPPVPIQSQLDPVHAPTSHFLKIQLNIIFPSMSRFSKWSLSLKFPHRNPVYASPLPHVCFMSHLSHSSRFYHPNNIGRGVQIIKLHII